MKKAILLTFFLTSIRIATMAQEHVVQLNSKITNVTVFLNGAQVQRQAEKIDIPSGVSQLVFSGLSSAIETQSIQARGEGNYTILSVTQQQNFLLEKQNSDQKADYLTTIANLTEQIAVLKNESEVYKAEEDMLVKNQTVMGPNANYDLVKLKQALDFQKQRLTEAKNKQIEINKAIVKLQESLNRYHKQLADLNGRSLTNSNDIVVKISAKVPVKGELSLTYLVNNASWYPTYDIRAKDIASPVELIYKANVSQNSGEDWKNVKLTLSSGNPSINQTKPDLAPYQLGYLSMGYSNTGSSTVRLVKGRVFSAADNEPLVGVAVRVQNTSVGTTTDAAGNYVIQIPSGASMLTFSYIGFVTKDMPINANQINVSLQESAQALQEVVVANGLAGSAAGLRIRGASSVAKSKMETNVVEVNTVQKQTNVIFDIKNPYTILSDGKQFAVAIGAYDFKADFEYYSAPKISEEAFLTAKLTDFSELNLIAGEANVFFEGTYLGKTLLDVQNVTDTLTISLGADKNVIVKREKQKDFNERQFIGSSQKDSKGFVIDIKNRKNQAVHLIIEDQLPLSTSSDITVDKQEISKAKYDEATGKLTWQLMLQPNDEKRMVLKYQVKYPKNRPINLE